MEQDNFQIYGNGVQYQTLQLPDLIPAIDREQARQRRADEQYLAQVRRNNEQRVENAKLKGQDLIALSKLSKTLVGALVENQKKQNQKEEAEAFNKAYSEYKSGNIDVSGFKEAMKAANEQDAVASDVEASVLNGDPNNYEASSPIGKATTRKQVATAKGIALRKTLDYATIVEEALVKINPQSSSELSFALEYIRGEFGIDKELAGLPPEFLAESVYPQLAKAEAIYTRKWKQKFAKTDSDIRVSEADADLSVSKDVAAYLSAVRNTIGNDGMPRGFSGSWELFVKSAKNAILAGDLSEADIVAMERQVMPKDPKGRTYGELHGDKFGMLRRQVDAVRRQDWRDDQTDRRQRFEQEEQEIIDALIDSSDTDGFTEQQAKDFGDALFAKHGIRSTRISQIALLSVDQQTRDKQEEEIENLMAQNLLTTERLNQFDPKLQKKYRSTAQTTDKLLADNGGMKVQLDAIKDAVEFKAGVTRDSRRHPTVGLMVAQQQQKFQRLVTQYAVAGNPDPVNAALNEVLTSFEQVPVSANGYESSFNFSAKNANEQMDYRIRFIDTHLKSYGKQVLNMPNTLFSSEQLQGMVKGFGSEGWTTDPQIDYIANKLGVDPLTALNKLLEASGMDALPPSPALEVVNQLTPTQQNLINKFKTPERTARGLAGLKTFKPEVVPGGYGNKIKEAADASNIPPAVLAALLEKESEWRQDVITGKKPSPSGALGIAQFMPKTAEQMGVDPLNTDSAIDGAARYLRHLMDNYGFDLRTAIYAYNAGPGTIQEYGIGATEENSNYYPEIMKRATKYGYSQVSLKDPALIRPSML